jgi:uncharacterized protein (TIGR03435 family)
VLDMTGLIGLYQISLDISLPDMAASPNGDPTGASIFAGVEKLGLKLESRKAPIDQLVIDHLEKDPTAN